jgi:pimeloyl-ACP methyl ester carboxylesterase
VWVTQAHFDSLRENKLTVPVLGVNGEYALKGTAEALRVYAENVSAAVIADSGHFIAEEQPERLLETLLSFFGRSAAAVSDAG